MIHHHPDDELLLAAAAGTLDTGASIVVTAHLESCAQCRLAVRRFEDVGGEMLEASEPMAVADDALAKALAAIDSPVPPRPAPSPRMTRPSLPAGLRWPHSLARCTVSSWRRLGPGMRYSRVTVPHDRDANVFLLRMDAGKAVARHTHVGRELTHVMHGSFHDGRSLFAAGDFDAADESVHHEPVLGVDSECICLASVSGRLVFDSAVARAISALAGI